MMEAVAGGQVTREVGENTWGLDPKCRVSGIGEATRRRGPDDDQFNLRRLDKVNPCVGRDDGIDESDVCGGSISENDLCHCVKR